MKFKKKVLVTALACIGLLQVSSAMAAGIAAAHVYHNHMPNFWPYYDVSKYAATPIGGEVRYMYDGQVINLKNSPPPNYTFFFPASQGGAVMPHDALVTYYAKDGKTGAYFSWPITAANDMKANAPKGQVHVTMSAAVVNNVESLVQLKNVPGYTDTTWGSKWKGAYDGLKTTGGNRTLDMIHFTGHHSMGPLVGNDYFLKDLIYHNVTLAQPYMLGNSFKSSKGFFPTELGFSERLIPVLAKLGIKWSVLGNNHLSRTLKDYPFDALYPNKDTMVSPPNRADLQNTSDIGAWMSIGMAHEQQQIHNKYPFASTPKVVRYVDAATGAESRVIGVPVDQAGSWLEGWEGNANPTAEPNYLPYEGKGPNKQFFVIAHDGDNTDGRAGSYDTWMNGRAVTCTNGVECMGIDDYIANNPVTEVAHVQDGSWVDTRDSSSDPQWHHWKLPFSIWKGQFAVHNTVTGLNLAPKTNLSGQVEGMTVSYEYGFHYLERNFALLQAAMNYAKTAEQIWLDKNPNHWKPTTAIDNEVTYPGNQLNPWMMSYPVKGDAANNYAGGANPAELGWYFLIPAMDSGFGYYDENKDDHVKGTIAFNQSLYFTKPYVALNANLDKTGPSVWWPQRWPYNPGSVNADKSEGWTVHHFNNVFSIYTYAYDVSGITSTKVKIRVHADKNILATDNTYKVYDPAAMKAAGVANIDPSRVGAWQDYPMTKRDLKPVMNGVAWNKTNMDTMAVVPAQEIGDLYYVYLDQYRDQLLDYYIESTDAKGNVTRSEIQQVYVGAGKYEKTATGYAESMTGTIEGTYPFLVEAVPDTEAPSTPNGLTVVGTADKSVSLSWGASTDNRAVSGYDIYRDGVKVGSSAGTTYTDSGLTANTSYSYSVKAFDAAANYSGFSGAQSATTKAPDTQAPSVPNGLALGTVTSIAVNLTWTPSTDNYGVLGYNIYRNGVKVGTSSGANYADTGLTPDMPYTYTVLAFDAAGNESAQSTLLSAKTLAGSSTTIYYNATAKNWTNVNIHYRVGTTAAPGTWTVAPGTTMDTGCVANGKTYKKYGFNLAAGQQVEAVFNNGTVWDNKGNTSGQNYVINTSGASIVNGDGTMTANAVDPCAPIVVVDKEAPSAPSNLANVGINPNSVALSWTASTDNVAVSGYKVSRDGVVIATVTSGTIYADAAAPAGLHTYSVVAFDAANNVSVSSNSVNVTVDVLCIPPVDPMASNSTFVQQMYRDFFAREADSASVTYWEGLLASGAQTRASLIQTFMGSGEFQAKAAPITRLYKAYFKRMPDHEGLWYWVGLFGNGKNVADISQTFSDSPEFKAAYGSLANSAFVDLVYQNVLGRAGDAAGKAYWLGLLDSGKQTRGDVMIGFSESAEHVSTSTNHLNLVLAYEGMLRRNVNATEYSTGLARLNAGVSVTQVIAELMAAAEYKARFAVTGCQ